MQDKSKKIFIIIAALVVGCLMPYLSRIPLACSYGAAWIGEYMTTSDDFIRWNGFHLPSLMPILLFGFAYIVGNAKWAFCGSVFGHFAATAFIYYNFGERHHVDDFLGCIVFPFPIGGASVLCGVIALVFELMVARRATPEYLK